MTIRDRIADFLAQKRIALVGVSRDKNAFGHRLFADMRARGYDVVPVNPKAETIAGIPCASRIGDVSPPVDGVLVLTDREQMEQIAGECSASGITRVWLHGNSGPGDVSQRAVSLCEDRGIRVVPGYCLYMFLPDAGFIHRFHGWLLKLMKRNPA